MLSTLDIRHLISARDHIDKLSSLSSSSRHTIHQLTFLNHCSCICAHVNMHIMLLWRLCSACERKRAIIPSLSAAERRRISVVVSLYLSLMLPSIQLGGYGMFDSCDRRATSWPISVAMCVRTCFVGAGDNIAMTTDEPNAGDHGAN